MRAFPFSMSSPAPTGLHYLLTITKGINTICFTTYIQPIVHPTTSLVYRPQAGCQVTNIQFASDGTPATAEVAVQFSNVSGSLFLPGDGVDGSLDDWPISIEVFDIGDLAAGTFDLMPNSTIGSVTENTAGGIIIPINGPLLKAMGPTTEHFSLTGNEVLGDDRCKMPIIMEDVSRGKAFVTKATPAPGLQKVTDCFVRVKLGSSGNVSDYQNVIFECSVDGTTDPTTAPIYNGTLGAVTVDGTAAFIARNAWTRYAFGQAISPFSIQLTALPDPRATDPTWYKLGRIWIRSGKFNGSPEIPIQAWDPVNFIVYTAFPVDVANLGANTQFEITAGCDQTPIMCNARFDNIDNIRAVPFVPPSNTQLTF